ncbi:hypothetical protein TNIN_349831, partial [Trichonephila inaurata madagascariensis]
YLRLLRNLCVSYCIRYSRDIYIQHLTGVQQYSAGAAAEHPDPVATEETTNLPNTDSSSPDNGSHPDNDRNSPDLSSQSAICQDNITLPTVGGESESTDL